MRYTLAAKVIRTVMAWPTSHISFYYLESSVMWNSYGYYIPTSLRSIERFMWFREMWKIKAYLHFQEIRVKSQKVVLFVTRALLFDKLALCQLIQTWTGPSTLNWIKEKRCITIVVTQVNQGVYQEIICIQSQQNRKTISNVMLLLLCRRSKTEQSYGNLCVSSGGISCIIQILSQFYHIELSGSGASREKVLVIS